MKNRELLSRALDVIEALENQLTRELRNAKDQAETRQIATELGAVAAAKAALETV